MKKTNKLTGAGVVPIFDNREGIFSDLKKDILYLALHDKKGRYDFPKGCIDLKHGELPYDCAIREMFEECNLSLKDFKENKVSGNTTEAGFMCGDRLLMFFGVVKNISNIKIKPNPEIQAKKGIDYYEHDGFSWLTYEEVMIVDKQKNKSVLRSFLVPALQQAKIWADKNI